MANAQSLKTAAIRIGRAVQAGDMSVGMDVVRDGLLARYQQVDP